MNKNKLLETIFFPRKSNNDIDSNDLLVKTSDSNSVGIRIFLKNKIFPTILYFHGNAELAQEYDSIADYYQKHEINLIVADYRGYGLSTGVPTKDNLHYDAKVIFRFVKNYLTNLNYVDKLYVMGRSLGSASAFEIIHNFEDDVAGCIIESGFVTEYPLFNLLNVNPEEINFQLEDGFMNLAKLKKYKGRFLAIHSDLDDIIPFSQAEVMMLESPSKEKDLFRVSGANHNSILMMAREEYFMKINEFIYK